MKAYKYMLILTFFMAPHLLSCGGSDIDIERKISNMESTVNTLNEERRYDEEIELLWFPEQIYEWREFYSQLDFNATTKEGIIAALDRASKTFDAVDPYNDEFTEALLDFGQKVDKAFDAKSLSATDKRNWTKRCVKKYNKCVQDAGSNAAERKKCLNRYRKCLNKCKR